MEKEVDDKANKESASYEKSDVEIEMHGGMLAILTLVHVQQFLNTGTLKCPHVFIHLPAFLKGQGKQCI